MNLPLDSPMVAVVIPYFQRRPGILAQAVASVLAQQQWPGAPAATIIVVDDASPVPARTELAALLGSHPGRLRVVEQVNGGPAAARNAALNAVPAGTRYVAFLDSDDAWQADHLQRAVCALEQGMDLYFADHYQLDQQVSAFRRAGRVDPARHPSLAHGADLHAWQGSMFDQILAGNIIGTSTVVYRHAAWPALRFRPEFVGAGEDYLFWLELCQLGARVAFSTRIACRYGAGVNIFSGANWGTPAALLRMHDEIRYRKALPLLFSLSPLQQHANRRQLTLLRRGFIDSLLHSTRRRQWPAPGLMLRHARLDPATFAQALPWLARRICKRVLSYH